MKKTIKVKTKTELYKEIDKLRKTLRKISGAAEDIFHLDCNINTKYPYLEKCVEESQELLRGK